MLKSKRYLIIILFATVPFIYFVVSIFSDYTMGMEMELKALLFFMVAAAVVGVMIMRRPKAKKTFKFPNGISFSYPSKYEVSDSTSVLAKKFLSGHWLPLIHAVDLKNKSDVLDVSFSMEIFGNNDGLTISDMLHLRQKIQHSLKRVPLLLTKTNFVGKDALLCEEFMCLGGQDFRRELTVLSGVNVVTISSTTYSKKKIDECRAIAQEIENSLKF